MVGCWVVFTPVSSLCTDSSKLEATLELMFSLISPKLSVARLESASQLAIGDFSEVFSTSSFKTEPQDRPGDLKGVENLLRLRGLATAFDGAADLLISYKIIQQQITL